MEGNVGKDKFQELAEMIDFLEKPNSTNQTSNWCLQEIFDNYPFPCDLDNSTNKPKDSYLTPTNLLQKLKTDWDVVQKMSVPDRVAYFSQYFNVLHGENKPIEEEKSVFSFF